VNTCNSTLSHFQHTAKSHYKNPRDRACSREQRSLSCQQTGALYRHSATEVYVQPVRTGDEGDLRAAMWRQVIATQFSSMDSSDGISPGEDDFFYLQLYLKRKKKSFNEPAIYVCVCVCSLPLTSTHTRTKTKRVFSYKDSANNNRN